MPDADPARGLQAIARVGCGTCHAVPGLRWPEGGVGPSLHGFGKANLVAGHLPNQPEVLAAFVRNAPVVLPGTTMPAMPLTEQEARDVAAYLYTLVTADQRLPAGRRRCSIRPAPTPARSRPWPGCCSRWALVVTLSWWPALGIALFGGAALKARLGGESAIWIGGASPSRSSC